MTAAYLKARSIVAQRKNVPAESVNDDDIYVYDVSTSQLILQMAPTDGFGLLMLKSGKGVKPTQAVARGTHIKILMADGTKFWKVV